MSAPPRIALRWLERRLQPDERQEIVGDLEEQFHRRSARDGERAARLWFWRQALALTWGFSLERRDVVSHAHERMRGRWFLWNAASDWRHAWRTLLASRGTTAIALLTLMLGIGLSTALFSLINGILLRPLPYPNADQLVRLTEVRPVPMGMSAVADLGGTISDIALGHATNHHQLPSNPHWYLLVHGMSYFPDVDIESKLAYHPRVHRAYLRN